MSKVWFVTGASRGLGRAIVQAALDSGASVIATARNPDSLKDFTEKFSAEKFLPLALDVTKQEEVIKSINAGFEKFARLDVIVNNAGYANVAPIEDIDIDDFRGQLETNFMGVVYVTKAALPILRKQGSGHIFQVSSVGGRLGNPGLCAYQSAKWAVGGFSTILAQEVAPFGVKVTVLEPGGMLTDWAGPSMAIAPVSEPYKQTVGMVAQMLRQYNGHEPSTPEKVAQIMIHLSKADEAPLRLLIGPDAVDFGGKAVQAIIAADEKWHDLSMSSV